MDRIQQMVRESFRSHFSPSSQPTLFYAPGRTELGGNHTDHQCGFTLAAAVEQGIYAAAASCAEPYIRLISPPFAAVSVDLQQLDPRAEERQQTAALVRGIAAGFAQKGYPLSGLELYLHSQLPVGCGLSSSAAFELLLCTVMNHFFCRDALSPLELARIGQQAEQQYFGKPCGMMDQLASAVGGVVQMDFADPSAPELYRLPDVFSAMPYALCLIQTGSQHAGLSEAYASIPREMSQVAAAFGCSVLREVPEDAFYAAVPRLSQTLGQRPVLRAMHFYGEERRVPQQTAALIRQDWEAFLHLVRESGRSSWQLLQNIHLPESSHQPMALALALCERTLQGQGACRVHGGGFAGAIQAYVPRDALDSFTLSMESVLGPGCIIPLTISARGAGIL